MVGPLIAIPLVAGFIGQVLVGSWTHLVPAIGPGDQSAHAVQRRWLGRAATPRLIAWNVGVAVAVAGTLAGWEALVLAGGALVGAGLASGLGLLVAAVIVSRRVARAVVDAARR